MVHDEAVPNLQRDTQVHETGPQTVTVDSALESIGLSALKGTEGGKELVRAVEDAIAAGYNQFRLDVAQGETLADIPEADLKRGERAIATSSTGWDGAFAGHKYVTVVASKAEVRPASPDLMESPDAK